MLEAVFDQARGLAAWELAPPTRVIPVVAGDTEEMRRHTLEWLWVLEQGLRAQGHPVAVQESLQGLSSAHVGLGQREILARWLKPMPAGGVVLLHAPLEALAVLLADSEARPVVALQDERKALVWAYNAVKVLVQAAGLQPVLLMSDGVPASRAKQVFEAFAHTCDQRLGVVPSQWVLGYDDQCSGVLRQAREACLLRVLDSALMMDDKRPRHDVDQRIDYRQSPADHVVGAPDVHRQRHA
jgi:hypothetical protein